MPVVIREDREQYMQELRDWLEQERDVPLEEMADFFHRRIDTYEEKMQTYLLRGEEFEQKYDHSKIKLLV